MQSWQERWGHKVVDAAGAVKKIEARTHIFVGSGAAEPCALVEALCTDGDHLHGNEILHLLTLGPAPYVAAEMAERFRHKAFFIGANTREAVQDGRADFMPVFLHQIPNLMRSGRTPVDVALVQVSEPDKHGYVSLGVAVDIVRAAVESAKLVIAEVNPRMPRTHGASFVHVDRIAALVPNECALPTIEPTELDDVAVAIGKNVAGLVPDGATLQTGIGSLPDAVLAELDDHRDLGVHTEMMSDGVMRLVEKGVITGRRKEMLPGKHVTSFLMGTEKLYAWADGNPAIEMRPSDYTNDPFRIGRHDYMIAINSALEVDLTGQVAADTVGGRFFSGIGGQVDFIRGAYHSKHGKPIIALRSTAKGGTISRIAAVMQEGAGVVTSRGDVHYVVTEHGVADLWGKTVRERARALIGIAEPKFREDLERQARARHFL